MENLTAIHNCNRIIHLFCISTCITWFIDSNSFVLATDYSKHRTNTELINHTCSWRAEYTNTSNYIQQSV